MDPAFIRNFSIIAHIDHGKSTLADRLLETTGALSEREMMAQVLDSMDLERERGITIKAHAVRLDLQGRRRPDSTSSISSTPPATSISPTRSPAACRPAKERLLVVDAVTGRRSPDPRQHLSGASHHNLELIPVINKIDLPAAEPERIKEQIEQIIGLDASRSAVLASAKNGIGIHDILEADRATASRPRKATRNARCSADFRFLVRFLPRRDHPVAHHRRLASGWGRRFG